MLFSSLKIKDDIIAAIRKLHFIEGEIEGVEFDELLSIDTFEYDEDGLDENSLVSIYAGEYYIQTITVGQFIKMADDKENLKINESHSYAKNDNEVYFLLDNLDYVTSEVLYNTFNNPKRYYTYEESPQLLLEKMVVIDGTTYSIGLFKGFCIFNLLVEESGKYDEFNPSFSPYDYFVRVFCKEKKIEMKIADALATSYVFELQSTFDLQLPFSSGRIDAEYNDRSDEDLKGAESRMFPLMYGEGTQDLLTLYNTAKNTVDLDFKILGFTKVIEYIAPTIAQKELIENVTLKLTSPIVFKPTATFIAELGAIYEKYQNISNKDAELIKIAVFTSIRLEEIWDKVPIFIKHKQVILPQETDHELFLERISECIYSTRNEIAHAKANYEKRGTECPQKEKFQFCTLLETIAVRCIRWFSLQPEEKRVILR